MLTTSRLLPAPLLLLLACNSNDAPTSASASETASSSDTGEPDASTGSTATTEPTSEPTSDASVATVTSDTDTTAPTTDGPALLVTTDIIRYTAQPMVADIVITTNIPVDSAELHHTTDPGVVIEAIAVDGLATTYRVRGLAPDTNHEVAYTVDGSEGSVPFITYPPLQGFIPSFPVTGDPPDPAVPYRMFDLIPFPAFDTASVFMVDGGGTTRWHYGGPSNMTPGPEGVYTAVKLRADGGVMYLHEHTMWIRDELSEPVLELTDDMLGVLGLHHELIQLPNNNYMALSFAFEDVDYGKDGIRETAGDVIVEFTPEGEVVWTWNAFDHLDPHRIVEPFATAIILNPMTLAQTYDWTHGNAIVHDPQERHPAAVAAPPGLDHRHRPQDRRGPVEARQRRRLHARRRDQILPPPARPRVAKRRLPVGLRQRRRRPRPRPLGDRVAGPPLRARHRQQDRHPGVDRRRPADRLDLRRQRRPPARRPHPRHRLVDHQRHHHLGRHPRTRRERLPAGPVGAAYARL